MAQRFDEILLTQDTISSNERLVVERFAHGSI